MKRYAFTLVELIAVMAAVSAVMGITVILLVQLFDFQQHYDEYSRQMHSTNRFVAVFRDDVHTHGKPEILTDGNVLLRWTTETETIEYTVNPKEFPDQLNVARTVRKEGQQQHYETYWLPDRLTLRFAEGVGDDAGLIALSLWTAPQRTATPNAAMPSPDELNPFDRTLLESSEQPVALGSNVHWRTIIARY